MTLIKLAIFDDSKTVQQVVVTTELEKDTWLSGNLDITDNYVLLSESETEPNIGWSWNEAKDAWIAPQPHSNWVLDDNNQWNPPLPKPTEEPEGDWFWHQEENLWKDVIHIPLEEQ